jgi:hypothetical protein
MTALVRLTGLKWPALAAAVLSVAALSSEMPATATAPAGGAILYENYDVADQPDIFGVMADGSGATNLTNNPAEDITAAWSPDATKIVFASDREQQGLRKLYIMNTDGSGVTKLTEGGGDFWPNWSPDGSTIVYRSGGDVWSVGSDGQPHPIYEGVETQTEPDFSPDGSHIAFASSEDGDFEIWVMDADGGNPMQLTHNTESDGDPSWSPDGTKIAFRGTSGGNADVWVMNANGTGLMNVSNDPAYDAGPDWSPDGSQIVFYSERDGNDGMYIMSAGGSGAQLVVPGDVFSFEWRPAVAGRIQGDADCDGDVDLDDAVALLSVPAGLEPDQEAGCPQIGGATVAVAASLPFGDVNCSGFVDAVDALGILLYLADLPVPHEHEPCTDVGSALPVFGLPPP